MGGQFLPTQVANLSAWYDASKLTGLNDGDTVTSWPDSSGNGLTLDVLGSTPLYKTNIFGSLPAVLYDGVNDYNRRSDVGATAIITAAAGTFLTVFRTAGSIINGSLIGLVESGVAGDAHVNTVAAGTTIVSINDDGTVDTTAGKTIAVSTNYIHTWYHSGGALYNGLSDTRTASMDTIASGNTTLAAGTDLFVGAATGFFSGHIAEAVFYARDLTESERQSVERYLASKYGITLPY
jgi:hypothetical protein